MATVFKRVKHYLHTRNKSVDEKFDMRLLGKIVVHEYWKFKNATEPIHRLKFTTDTGETYPIITYPRKFIPVIDAVINKYYNETYPKKERPRSPYNGKRPIYSAKPRFTNQINNL